MTHAKLSDAMRWALMSDEPLFQLRSTVAALVKRELAAWASGPLVHKYQRSVDILPPWALTERGERVRDCLLAKVAAANAASDATSGGAR